MPERTFEACLQKALTFLTERVFCRELRQYGRNPAVQCRRLGISKPDCRCNCDTICSWSLNFNITFLNATCAKDKIINHGTQNSNFCVGSDFFWLVSWHAFGFYHVGTRSDISLEAFLLREFRTSQYNSE